MKVRTWTTAGFAVAAVLLVLGIGLAFNNPTIDHTDDGTYQCFAPYDTILFGNRNDVGMHDDSGDIDRRCYAANRDRFLLACGLGALGLLVGVTCLVTRHRRT